MAVDPISTYRGIGTIGGMTPGAAAPSGSAAAGAPGAFGDSLNRMLASVEESAGTANSAVANMVEGTGDVHTAMIALQRAEMTLELTVQVRNKLVQAYQDVMRMPI
jgi:flagellar hook-basal body complex protein FliE